MSIPRQRSSRENGAKSKGPTSGQGKAISARNAIRHGLFARDLLLSCETQECLDDHMAAYISRLQPTSEMEMEIVQEIGGAAWRLHRARAIESRILDKGIVAGWSEASAAGLDGPGIVAEGSVKTLESKAFTNLGRYEARLQRTYNRAFQNLILLRRAPELALRDEKEWKSEPTLAFLDDIYPPEPASGAEQSPESPENANIEPTLRFPNPPEDAPDQIGHENHAQQPAEAAGPDTTESPEPVGDAGKPASPPQQSDTTPYTPAPILYHLIPTGLANPAYRLEIAPKPTPERLAS